MKPKLAKLEMNRDTERFLDMNDSIRLLVRLLLTSLIVIYHVQARTADRDVSGYANTPFDEVDFPSRQ